MEELTDEQQQQQVQKILDVCIDSLEDCSTSGWVVSTIHINIETNEELRAALESWEVLLCAQLLLARNHGWFLTWRPDDNILKLNFIY